jgi:hypothetical protein
MCSATHPGISLRPQSRIEPGLGACTGGLAGWSAAGFTRLVGIGSAAQARRQRSFGRQWPVAVLLLALLDVGGCLLVTTAQP